MRRAPATLTLLLLIATPVGAQEWPTRPVTMIVPYAAGGPVDTLGRILGARLGEVLGQQITIENVGGAGGMTGASRVAKAEPDGYTFLMGSSAVLAINQTLYKRPLYDATSDFAPVALVTDSARVLITRKDFPANNFLEFVAYAKANAPKMQYGSAGAGSGAQVCALLLDQAMGTKITHVPYRGTAPAMQDMIGGRIDYICEQISTALPQIQGKAVKALATLGLDRVPGLEELPTADELGFKGLDCGSWGAFVHVGADRAQTRQGRKRHGRDARGPQATQRNRRDSAGRRAPYTGVSWQVYSERNRALGRADPRQWGDGGLRGETVMDEEVLNTSLRRFLKKVGITAQREIEKAVREGIASGKLKGHEALPAKATFNIEGVNLKFEVNGDVELT
jgi:tripartite-type tricarboxylate transporter receptor subunit TctC